MGAEKGDGAILPRDVIYRPKQGFGAFLRRLIRHELRELLGGLLSADCLISRGLSYLV